jgi:hypothetical protein
VQQQQNKRQSTAAASTEGDGERPDARRLRREY